MHGVQSFVSECFLVALSDFESRFYFLSARELSAGARQRAGVLAGLVVGALGLLLLPLYLWLGCVLVPLMFAAELVSRARAKSPRRSRVALLALLVCAVSCAAPSLSSALASLFDWAFLLLLVGMAVYLVAAAGSLVGKAAVKVSP